MSRRKDQPMVPRMRTFAGVVLMTISAISGCEAADVHRLAAERGVTLTDAQAEAIAAHHSRPRSVQQMIRDAWAGTGHEERAVRVAKCESAFNPSARNGQYAGIFQMGCREWATYGRGGDPFNADENIAAARRYWGRAGWRPWECKG